METDVEFSICGGTLENKTLSFEMFQISESGLPNLYFIFNLTPHQRLKFLSLSEPRLRETCCVLRGGPDLILLPPAQAITTCPVMLGLDWGFTC